MKCSKVTQPSLETVRGTSPRTQPTGQKRSIPVSTGPEPVEAGQFTVLVRKAQAAPDVRRDLVEQVKAEIRAGDYETPERIRIAVERLAEDLRAA